MRYRKRWTRGMLVLACLALALPGWTQIASGVVVEVQMGPLGTGTDLLLAPNVDKPLQDTTWVYEQFPHGAPNPDFPPPPIPPTLPLQPALPGNFVDLATLWPPFSESHLVFPGPRDAQSTMKGVLATEIEVKAWLPWQDSGITLMAGQRFEVEAEGRWSSHYDQWWCGPEGNTDRNRFVTNRAGHPPSPCPTAIGGALVARIGRGAGFYVGPGGEFTANASGNLQFMMNDIFDGAPRNGDCRYCGTAGGHLCNNVGSLRVLVIPLN